MLEEDISISRSGGLQSNSQFAVTVTNPTKHGDGPKAYIAYNVTTSTSVQGYQPSSSVIRRYSDFAWLASQLASCHVGVILPPLPDKALVGRFSDDFVEQRRAQLEQYINRILAHPTLAASHVTKAFLQQSDLPSDMVDNTPATGDAVAEKRSGGFFDRIKEMSTSAQIGLAQSGWIKQDISLPHDVQCEEMKAYLNALEAQLLAVQKFTEKLIQRHREIASSVSEFGLAVNLLGNCETDSAFLANGLSQLASSSDRLSAIHHQHADKEQAGFEERIKDYLRVVACAKEAIKGRDRALAAYRNAYATMEWKKQKLVKVQSLTPPNPQKVQEAEQEIRDAERECDSARLHHEAVSQVTRTEMQRFQQEKIGTFKAMVAQHVKLQVDHARQVQGVWASLLPEIEALGQTNPNA